jgi:hypothetical protein
MNRTWIRWSSAALLLFASPSLAAEAAVTPGQMQPQSVQDRSEVTFNEIERGFYFSLSGGPNFISKLPAEAAGALRPSSSGILVRLEAGYDLGERLSLGLFAMLSTAKAGSDYLGNSDPPGSASGDYTQITPGITARLSFVGFKDSQEVKRTWLYVRAGAGYAMFSPKTLLPDSDILVFGGPGLEYYTRLRHFSVGLEVTGSYLVSAKSLAIAVTPNLKYAF